MADYTKKLYIAGTDIVDVIKETADASTSLPDVGTSGSAGATADLTMLFKNGSLSNANGTSSDVGNNKTVTIGSVSIPYFTVDAKGRVTSKSNRTLNINAQYYNYYNYRNYSSGD